MRPKGSVRRWGRWIAAAAAITVLALSGPRAQESTNGASDYASTLGSVRAPETLAEWPSWLAARERSAGVTDTAKMRRMLFADSAAPARTAWSVVYLHGFSATRQETAPVSEQVAQALGANLYEARLRGHGLPGDSMGVATARDWMRDAEEALTLGAVLGDSVLVIATSTGGTLAAWLASRPDSLRRGLQAVALISPNFGVNGAAAKVLSWPWAPVLIPRLIPTYSWTPRSEAHGRYWTTTYPSRALFPMTALVDVVDAAPLTGWSTPTLVFYNTADAVVDAAATTRWIERLRQATTARVAVEQVVPQQGEDGHVIAGRITAPSRVAPFTERIVRFVRGGA